MTGTSQPTANAAPTAAPASSGIRGWCGQLALLGGLLLLIALVLALGGWATASSVGTWYAELRKPAWTPPPWVFGPVWTALYVMIALAGFCHGRAVGFAPQARRGWWLYGAQLLVNGAWSGLFFGLRNPLLGLLDIVLLIALLVLTRRAFAAHSRAASWLLLPYLLWVLYASTLNAGIVLLN